MRFCSKHNWSIPLALGFNLCLSMFIFILCRAIFYWVNKAYFPDLNNDQILNIIRGGWVFDLSALVYINGLYILMMAIPMHYKENKTYQQAAKWVFILLNSAAIVLNLMDTVYFRFTNRRTTASIFSEFSSEGNIAAVITNELVSHWHLTCLAMLLIVMLFKAYRKPNIPAVKHTTKGLITYYLISVLLLAGIVPCAVAAIRGGFGHAVRPITISNANQYVNRPIEAAIVLNTPFSMIRTIGKKVYKEPNYYESGAVLDRIFTPFHQPSNTTLSHMNVVVIIVESLAKEYIGSLNKTLDDGAYSGYTPFIDSLLSNSLTFEHTFANGRKSIDGMPSVLSSVPMFIEPYFLTHYSMNKISSIGGELKKKGYHTSFFHGAPNGSMGFEAFARTSGYDEYYGLNEYGNKQDFDGMWAIWDEEFLQFFANSLNSFPQPFTSAIFTASSHHPFKIPSRYESVFKEGELPMHKCIQYTDMALQRFFDKAKTMPWFENTLFVITGDHTNQSNHAAYMTDLGLFTVPIILYHPNSALKGVRSTIAQQIDIMPTVLNYVGYDAPFIAFGRDLLHSEDTEGYAVNYINGIYQYTYGSFVLQFDGLQSIAVYDYIADPLLKENLLGSIPEQAIMEKQLKAIIQQYIERMLRDELTVTNK